MLGAKDLDIDKSIEFAGIGEHDGELLCRGCALIGDHCIVQVDGPILTAFVVATLRRELASVDAYPVVANVAHFAVTSCNHIGAGSIGIAADNVETVAAASIGSASTTARGQDADLLRVRTILTLDPIFPAVTANLVAVLATAVLARVANRIVAKARPRARSQRYGKRTK